MRYIIYHIADVVTTYSKKLLVPPFSDKVVFYAGEMPLSDFTKSMVTSLGERSVSKKTEFAVSEAEGRVCKFERQSLRPVRDFVY
jgi:hypothetical protein